MRLVSRPNRAWAIFKLLWKQTTEGSVSPAWLLRRPSVLDQKFRQEADVLLDQEGGVQKITINDEVFFWPLGAPLEPLLNIVSELQNPKHPNHYLWGKTQISWGDVVMDIGACEGGFSALAASRGARVICVEPSRLMVELIGRLFEARQLGRPLVVNSLLGLENGSRPFLDRINNPGTSRHLDQVTPDSYLVAVTTLDDLAGDLALRRLDFIKCDAEGADVEILKGGRNTLQRFHPKLAICTYHNDGDFDELYDYLRGLGYRVEGKGFLNAHSNYRVIMLHAWFENGCRR